MGADAIGLRLARDLLDSSLLRIVATATWVRSESCLTSDVEQLSFSVCRPEVPPPFAED